MVARDKNGEVIAEGEEVIIRGRVTHISHNDNLPNVTIETIETIELTRGGAASTIYLHAHQVEISQAADGSTQG